MVRARYLKRLRSSEASVRLATAGSSCGVRFFTPISRILRHALNPHSRRYRAKIAVTTAEVRAVIRAPDDAGLDHLNLYGPRRWGAMKHDSTRFSGNVLLYLQYLINYFSSHIEMLSRLRETCRRRPTLVRQVERQGTPEGSRPMQAWASSARAPLMNHRYGVLRGCSRRDARRL
jgi:hypothetical protein